MSDIKPMLEPAVRFAVPDKAELGYCQSCGQPTAVGHLTLKGWKHRALICAICLQGMANALSTATSRVFKEEDLR